jgi:enoyl-CoA hydratase
MSQVLLVDGPRGDDRAGVAWLTLNRPDKRNALSIELRDAIADALDALAADDTVKCVVITGAGTTFSAGFDLREFENADPDFQTRLWASSDRYHHTVLTFPLPTIAAVNGPALAGGFDLAVLCDVRIAAPTARFAHPEREFGDVVYAPLHDLVGGAVARELCLTGRAMEADEALRVRLVSQVVPTDSLHAAARALAEQTATAPRDVLVRTKAKALRRAGVDPATGTLDL